jgi:hypothetical protein
MYKAQGAYKQIKKRIKKATKNIKISSGVISFLFIPVYFIIMSG